MNTVVDVQAKIEAFDFEVNMADRFRLDGTVVEDGKEIFVIRDYKYKEDSQESHVFIPVSEVCDKPVDQIMKCLHNDRKSVVCDQVTRIVGYYSRVGNWNKSKVGELRDRQNGRYGQAGFKKEHHEEAMAVVNNR
jgi:hypothetical protein